MLTPEEKAKGYQTYGFMNETAVVDPSRYASSFPNPAQNEVVRRYTNPAPTTPAPTPATPATPTAPAASSTPATPYTPPSNPITDYYNNLKRDFTAEDETAIREKTRQSMQSQIDAINAQYATLYSQEAAAQDKLAAQNAGRTRAITSRGGLIGSDFGNTHIQNDAENSAKSKSAALKVLEEEKNVRIQGILGNIEARSSELIKAAKEEARGNAEAYIKNLERSQEQAKADLQIFAQAGGNLESLNPAQRTALFKQAGFDENFGTLYLNALRPKPEQIDYQYIEQRDGSILAIGQDPLTGELKKQVIPGASPDVGIVIDMITKYPDAGISPTDDVLTASQKIQNSRLYKSQTPLMEVSEGNTLVDPLTGKPVYTAPKKFAPSSGGGGSSVVSSGGGGGGTTPGQLSPQADAVMKGTLRLEDLTPTVRGQIAGELTQAGYTPTQPLSAGQREQIDKLDTLLREANSAQTILESGINTGPLASRLKAGAALFGGAQDFTQYRSVLNNMGSILLQARSGAAVTPEEFERIKGFIPLPNDDEKTAKTKIERFMQEMTAARDNYIKRGTQTSSQIKSGSDTPSSSDPLGIR